MTDPSEPPLVDFDTACTAMHDHDPINCAPGVGEGKHLHVVYRTPYTHCANCGDQFDEDAAGFLLASNDTAQAVCDTCAAHLNPAGHRALRILRQAVEALEEFDEAEARDLVLGIARGAGWLLAEMTGDTELLDATDPGDLTFF